MKIAIIVLYISMIAWIFPIFRQYKCNLFYFFLFLGLTDPITELLSKIIHLSPGPVPVIVAPFLFYFINIDRQKPFRINGVEIFVFVLAYALILVVKKYQVIVLIIDILILLRIIFKIIIELHNNRKLNIFYLVLAFYETTCVASLIIYLNGEHQSIILFIINFSFQILFAIFFSIFIEDHPKLTYIISPAIKE